MPLYLKHENKRYWEFINVFNFEENLFMVDIILIIYICNTLANTKENLSDYRKQK